MTARDEFLQRLGGALMDRENPAALTEVLDKYDAASRAEVAEEFAAALLAVDPVEWALAGQHAGADAAALIRRMADAATPTSKEPQR